jgi:hypothetical protein
MNPSINAVKVRVFRLDTTNEHEFRNRPASKETAYALIDEVKAQTVWFSHEELQRFQSMDRVRSDGYFIFRNVTLARLGINPSPDGGNWNRYRFQPNINGTHSTRMLEVVEMRPESPHRGVFKLWYAYFTEVLPEGVLPSSESPTEENPTLGKNIDVLVDRVTTYE